MADVMMVVKFGWPFVILFAIVWAKLRWKAWVIDVVILERRGENIVKTNDRAGRYVDKFTKLEGYKLLKAKDTLPVIDYKWILHNNNKPTNLLEKLVSVLRPTLGTLFLFKYGSKQYKPLIVNANDNKEEVELELEEIKDKNGDTIYVERYQQFDPRGYLNSVKMEVFDWDNMNFAFQEMRASFERRQKEGQWMKTILMPIAILAVVAMVSIVMIKFSAQYQPTIISTEPSNLANQPIETPNIPIIGDAFAPK